MNVADSTTQINPPIPSISNPEQLCQHLDQLVGDLKSNVCQAAQKSASFDTVELNVRKSLNEIGKAATDLFIQLQGDGDLGEEVVTDQGQKLRRSDQPARTVLRSTFGVHRFQQFTYSPGPKKAIQLRPISARMSLPEHRWSFLLQEWTQMLAIDSAYWQAKKIREGLPDFSLTELRCRQLGCGESVAPIEPELKSFGLGQSWHWGSPENQRKSTITTLLKKPKKALDITL